MEEGFLEEHAEADRDEMSKAQLARIALLKRRQLDDVIEERRLSRQLRDYDFDLDDE